MTSCAPFSVSSISMFCGFPSVSSSEGLASSFGWFLEESTFSFLSSGIGRKPGGSDQWIIRYNNNKSCNVHTFRRWLSSSGKFRGSWLRFHWSHEIEIFFLHYRSRCSGSRGRFSVHRNRLLKNVLILLVVLNDLKLFHRFMRLGFYRCRLRPLVYYCNWYFVMIWTHWNLLTEAFINSFRWLRRSLRKLIPKMQFTLQLFVFLFELIRLVLKLEKFLVLVGRVLGFQKIFQFLFLWQHVLVFHLKEFWKWRTYTTVSRKQSRYLQHCHVVLFDRLIFRQLRLNFVQSTLQSVVISRQFLLDLFTMLLEIIVLCVQNFVLLL